MNNKKDCTDGGIFSSYDFKNKFYYKDGTKEVEYLSEEVCKSEKLYTLSRLLKYLKQLKKLHDSWNYEVKFGGDIIDDMSTIIYPSDTSRDKPVVFWVKLIENIEEEDKRMIVEKPASYNTCSLINEKRKGLYYRFGENEIKMVPIEICQTKKLTNLSKLLKYLKESGEVEDLEYEVDFDGKYNEDLSTTVAPSQTSISNPIVFQKETAIKNYAWYDSCSMNSDLSPYNNSWGCNNGKENFYFSVCDGYVRSFSIEGELTSYDCCVLTLIAYLKKCQALHDIEYIVIFNNKRVGKGSKISLTSSSYSNPIKFLKELGQTEELLLKKSFLKPEIKKGFYYKIGVNQVKLIPIEICQKNNLYDTFTLEKYLKEGQDLKKFEYEVMFDGDIMKDNSKTIDPSSTSMEKPIIFGRKWIKERDTDYEEFFLEHNILLEDDIFKKEQLQNCIESFRSEGPWFDCKAIRNLFDNFGRTMNECEGSLIVGILKRCIRENETKALFIGEQLIQTIDNHHSIVPNYVIAREKKKEKKKFAFFVRHETGEGFKSCMVQLFHEMRSYSMIEEGWDSDYFFGVVTTGIDWQFCCYIRPEYNQTISKKNFVCGQLMKINFPFSQSSLLNILKFIRAVIADPEIERKVKKK